jgi:hypothetical protein
MFWEMEDNLNLLAKWKMTCAMTLQLDMDNCYLYCTFNSVFSCLMPDDWITPVEAPCDTMKQTVAK